MVQGIPHWFHYMLPRANCRQGFCGDIGADYLKYTDAVYQDRGRVLNGFHLTYSAPLSQLSDCPEQHFTGL